MLQFALSGMQRIHGLRSAGLNLLHRLRHSSSHSHSSLHLFNPSANSIHSLSPFFRSTTSHWHSPIPINPPLHSLMIKQKQAFATKKKTRKPTKTKMKSYSSFKFRFRTLANGDIRRWRAGKRHNAHSKSKKSKRRLRQPAVVTPAYAKVMKRLNFCG